jgi:nucleotide-binding universal stress UspA family protein
MTDENADSKTEASNVQALITRTADQFRFGLHKILVPVDFSEGSNEALEYATALSRQSDAELLLLHVIEPYPPIPQMDRVDLVALQDARRNLEDSRARLPATIRSKAVLRIGEVDREIIKAAEESGADLVILFTHPHSKVMHALRGSTMEKVARRAACPILVVREGEHGFIEPFQSP